MFSTHYILFQGKQNNASPMTKRFNINSFIYMTMLNNRYTSLYKLFIKHSNVDVTNASPYVLFISIY